MSSDPAAHHAPPAVELEGLGRRYGREFVLREVDLEITAGRIVVLTGSNGSGKTTLLRVLATRLRPSRGAGRIFGFDLVRDAPQVRAAVAYLGVLGGSYPALSAAENLRLAAALYPDPTGRDVGRLVGSLLDQVALGDATDKLVREFSSGMKKRLAIARLLMVDAPLWLLDEPYAALDEAGKAMIDDLLVAARREGRTVLLASHEVERSGRFADAVIEVVDGGLRTMSTSMGAP